MCRQDREYSIDVGLRMLTLRHIVEEKDGLFSVVSEEQTILAYYANSIAHYRPGPIASASQSRVAGSG
jgi:glycerol-3-phosphate O-acyltransferase